MECKHEIQHLLGDADGIVCQACGRRFKDYNEVLKATEEPAPEAPAKPKAKRASKKEAKPE